MAIFCLCLTCACRTVSELMPAILTVDLSQRGIGFTYVWPCEKLTVQRKGRMVCGFNRQLNYAAEESSIGRKLALIQPSEKKGWSTYRHAGKTSE